MYTWQELPCGTYGQRYCNDKVEYGLVILSLCAVPFCVWDLLACAYFQPLDEEMGGCIVDGRCCSPSQCVSVSDNNVYQ